MGEEWMSPDHTRLLLAARLAKLEPGSDEFKRVLLAAAEKSRHPNDVAIARILRRELGEVEDGT